MKLINLIPKKILIALTAGATCTVAVVAGLILVNGEQDYRSIQVYEIEGTANVERQGSVMEAYDNMQLKSGDVLTTDVGSYVQLKLDEDKYILMEPETRIHLEASGNSQDSKTSIYLDQGAIVNRIDNKLSEQSSYQVTTPNSTMAVRGTVFRVEITYDEEKSGQAVLSVYGGQVQCNLVFPDQSIDEEAVMVQKGTKVLVLGDDTDVRYAGTEDIAYEELKMEVLIFLHKAIDNEHELSISEDELAIIMETIDKLEEQEEMPVATDAVDSTKEPAPTQTPTPTAESEPVETPTPSLTPQKTPVPVVAPAPITSPVPTQTPSPTVLPTIKPAITETSTLIETETETESATETEESEDEPAPIKTPAPVKTPAQTQTESPAASTTPTATSGVEGTESPDSGATPTVSPGVEGTESPETGATPTVSPGAEGTESPETGATPAVSPDVEGTESPETGATPTVSPGVEGTESPETGATPTVNPDAEETGSQETGVTPEVSPSTGAA